MINEPVLLLVDDGDNGVKWVEYHGTTSLRKIYYKVYEAKKFNYKGFYVYEYGKNVRGAVFPNNFWRQLSCVSIDGVDSHNLPHMIILDYHKHTWIYLGDGSGKICTYCGKKG